MANLNKEDVHVGQLLHMKYVYDIHLAVVLKKFDTFMIIRYKSGAFENTMEAYYDDLSVLKLITEDGKPVFANKNIFGRYKLKLP